MGEATTRDILRETMADSNIIWIVKFLKVDIIYTQCFHMSMLAFFSFCNSPIFNITFLGLRKKSNTIYIKSTGNT